MRGCKALTNTFCSVFFLPGLKIRENLSDLKEFSGEKGGGEITSDISPQYCCQRVGGGSIPHPHDSNPTPPLKHTQCVNCSISFFTYFHGWTDHGPRDDQSHLKCCVSATEVVSAVSFCMPACVSILSVCNCPFVSKQIKKARVNN